MFGGIGRDTHSYFKVERRRGCRIPGFGFDASCPAGDICNPFRLYSGGGPTLVIGYYELKVGKER